MAQYDKETKFYWLQLKEDFFEDDAIQWLEEQQPNGRDYAYFYLKLCLKSLKSNGILIRKVGNILIPYDNKKLAELTKMDFDTVAVAMELLKKIGLVKILENGEIYIEQLQNLIGSKSIGAFKKQQQIARRESSKKCLGGQGVENLPPKIDIELEIDKEIDNIYIVEKLDDKKEENFKNTIEQVVDYLNMKTGSKYKSTTSKTKTLIKARLKDGFAEKDFLKVIDNKCYEWLGTDYEKYLRPETLFGTKFESYLNQKTIEEIKQERNREIDSW